MFNMYNNFMAEIVFAYRSNTKTFTLSNITYEFFGSTNDAFYSSSNITPTSFLLLLLTKPCSGFFIIQLFDLLSGSTHPSIHRISICYRRVIALHHIYLHSICKNRFSNFSRTANHIRCFLSPSELYIAFSKTG